MAFLLSFRGFAALLTTLDAGFFMSASFSFFLIALYVCFSLSAKAFPFGDWRH